MYLNVLVGCSYLSSLECLHVAENYQGLVFSSKLCVTVVNTSKLKKKRRLNATTVVNTGTRNELAEQNKYYSSVFTSLNRIVYYIYLCFGHLLLLPLAFLKYKLQTYSCIFIYLLYILPTFPLECKAQLYNLK